MIDFLSRTPIRTEANTDVVVRLVDGSVTTQYLKINADGSLNFTDNGGSITVDAVALDIRPLAFATDKVDVSGSAVTVSATDLDIRNLVFATDKVDVSGSSVTVSATDLDIRNLVFATDKVDVSGSAVTVSATDLDIRNLDASTDSVKAWLVDQAGNAFSEANPLAVTTVESAGTEVNDYDDANEVAGGSAVNHDYTVTAGKTLKFTQFHFASAGKAKFTVSIETGVASGTFTKKFTRFTGPSGNGSDSPIIKEPISVAAGVRVRIEKTNLESSATDLYTTICGHEI